MSTFKRTAAIFFILLLIPISATGQEFFDYDTLFSDFSTTNEFSDAIFLLYDFVIIDGNDDGTFAPDRLVNRAELSKMLVNTVYYEDETIEGGCFQDVVRNSWYEPFVCKSKALGLVSGDGGAGQIFRPSDTSNVGEIVSTLNQVFEWGVVKTEGEFWYVPLMTAASERDLLAYDWSFDQPVTRAMASDMLARAIVVSDLELERFVSYEDYYAVLIEIDEFADEIGDVDYAQVFQDPEQISHTYNIVGDDIVLVAGEPDLSGQHQAMWDRFVALIPADQRSDIVQYEIFGDGKDGTMAYANPLLDDPTQWAIGMDPEDAFMGETLDQKELTYSLIHEFGHVLTLRASQVSPLMSTDENYDQLALDCLPQYFPGEGCSLPASYINQFFQKFWADIHEEFVAIFDILDDDEYFVALDAFYAKYSDRFLTDYAVTNPGEDIAESWTAFVLNDKPTEASVADQKVLIFYDYPELMRLRTEIRKELVSF